MKKQYTPFNPLMPDPTDYFIGEERKIRQQQIAAARRELLTKIVAGALLLTTVGVGSFVYAVTVFSLPSY